MSELDLEAITIVGLVKPPRRHNEISHLLRFGYEDKPIYFENGVPAFRLVQQIRRRRTRVARFGSDYDCRSSADISGAVV